MMKGNYVRQPTALLGAVVFILLLPALAIADGLTVNAYPDRSRRVDPGEFSVRLVFNHPVFVSSVYDSVDVTFDGKKIEFRLVKTRDGKPATGPPSKFALVPKIPKAAAGRVRVAVSKDLTDASGRRTPDREYAFEFSSVDEIKVRNFATFYRSPQDKGIYLTFSDRVTTDEVRAAVELTPEPPGLYVAPAGYRRFQIRGDFARDREYVLSIRPIGVNQGQSVFVAREITFKGPGIRPDLAFKTKRSVVELKSRQLVPISMANVTKVRCRIARVPGYLIPETDPKIRKAVGHTDRLKPDHARGVLAKLSEIDEISSRFMKPPTEDSEVFFAREAKHHEYVYSAPLSFRSNPEEGGFWDTRLTDPDRDFTGESQKFVQITDLAINYRLSSKGLLLWVTSIHGGAPVAGADLLLCADSGETFFVGATDENGVLAVTAGETYPAVRRGAEENGAYRRQLEPQAIRWAVAATETDTGAIRLDRRRIVSDMVTQTKRSGDAPSAIKGKIFTERGIYRPGERVFFKLTVREYTDGSVVSPEGLTMVTEILDPKGNVVYKEEDSLSGFGTLSDSLETKTFFPVGTYTIRAYPKDDARKGNNFTTTFQVQEYKRPRHYVTLTMKTEERVDTEYVSLERRVDYLIVKVQSRYYAGGPVKHAKAAWKASLTPHSETVKGREGYFFGNRDDEERFLESGESMLDKEGNLTISLPLDPSCASGLYGLKMSVTVLDVDGEPATDTAVYEPEPDYRVGITRTPREVRPGYAGSLRAIVLDAKGDIVKSGSLEATVLRKQYFYTLKRDQSGNVNYLWEEGWMKSQGSRIPIHDGVARYDVELNDYGEHLIAFTYASDGNSYTSRTVFTVGQRDYDRWSGRQDKTGTPTAEEILLSTVKKTYRIGETAVVEFNTRRPVKSCLITVERDRVLEHRVIPVNGRRGRFEVKVSEDFMPNAYVTVSAAAGRKDFPLYPVDADTDIPTIYFGYLNIEARRDVRPLKVSISPDRASLNAKPGERVDLSFSVVDDNDAGVEAELAVCVVDEAVLALTRYRTPSLASLNRFTLPLSVFSGDLRLALVSQDLFRIFTTKPLTGGGYGAGHVAASIRKDFRPVAYFNPAIHTDRSGSASVSFTLPDSTTTYRIYAVACDKGAGFDSAERSMRVVKEFFLEPSTPRFLIPGDTITFPVSAHNKTDAEGEATLHVESSEDFESNLEKTSIGIAGNSIESVSSTVTVVRGGEHGTLRYRGALKTEDAAYSDAIEKIVSIESRYLPVRLVKTGQFTGSLKAEIDLPDILAAIDPADINPNDFKAVISLTTTDWNKIAPGLTYLLRYPFGCIEQTSSGIIPLAGMRALIEDGLIRGVSTERVDAFLKKGVARLLGMQLDNGGFSYWPGRRETSWWGTQYAAFALTQAHKAGYPVPPERLTAALNYIRKTLFGKKGVDPYHGQAWTKELALLNLAEHDMLSKAELGVFFEDYDSVNDQSSALLILAAHRIGFLSDAELRKRLKRLDPKIDAAAKGYRAMSYRTVAMCLLAAEEIGRLEKQADSWSGMLIRGLKPEGRWMSTADTGWCLLALKRYFENKDPAAKEVPCAVRIGETERRIVVSEKSEAFEIDPRSLLHDGTVRFRSDGKTPLSYTIEVTYPDMATDPADLRRGFALHKRIENLNGKDEIRVGDVVRVVLEISTEKDREGPLEYVALEDPVPAGLVPINSELETEGTLRGDEQSGESAPWREGFFEFRPTYAEFLDDGVRVFKNRCRFGSYGYRYTYLARAAAAGDFWLRGSRVSLMYEPDFFGKTKGRRLVVRPAK